MAATAAFGCDGGQATPPASSMPLPAVGREPRGLPRRAGDRGERRAPGQDRRGLVGIGLPHARSSPGASAATPLGQAPVDAAGDVIRHCFDAAGRLIDREGEGRMIAASPERLCRAPLAVGAAVGVGKVAAILDAVRSGIVTALVTALVTDVRTAGAVLASVQRRPRRVVAVRRPGQSLEGPQAPGSAPVSSSKYP